MDKSPPESAQNSSIASHAVTAAEVRSFAEAIGLRQLIIERCSLLFTFQLYCSARVPTLPFGDPVKTAAEVRALEGFGQSRTKPAEEFDRPPLRGFWRKHYIVGGMSSLALNVKLGLGKKSRELRRIVRKHWNPDTAHLPPEVVSQNIADAVVAKYWERARAQSLTGEWIVFARHEAQNYYLCLATHDEARANRTVLVERIKGCTSEFPFLLEQLEKAANVRATASR
jgi:hypothetical protein